MTDIPFVFATRKSEIKFWTAVANAVFDGWPWYHQYSNEATCACCSVAIHLGMEAEEKIIKLMEK